jgi:uncharacterized membrane protein YgdD (TMEM256/DUF423 family)
MQASRTALIAYAGLAGAAGVALAAAGAHGADLSALTTPAYLLIMHAAAAIALVATTVQASCARLTQISALVLLVGVSLFSGDIALRTIEGARLFPMAAPIGGTTMIAGWLLVAGSGLWELISRKG